MITSSWGTYERVRSLGRQKCCPRFLSLDILAPHAKRTLVKSAKNQWLDLRSVFLETVVYLSHFD